MKIILLGLVTVVAFSSCKKKGCMDPNANNFNAEAEKDDGSCTYDSVVPPAPPTYTVPSTYYINGMQMETIQFLTVVKQLD